MENSPAFAIQLELGSYDAAVLEAAAGLLERMADEWSAAGHCAAGSRLFTNLAATLRSQLAGENPEGVVADLADATAAELYHLARGVRVIVDDAYSAGHEDLAELLAVSAWAVDHEVDIRAGGVEN